MMRKIVFTGPESTGKTTLTEKLAGFLNLPHVQEVSRAYIHNLNGIYSYEDLCSIAMLQMSEEEKIKSLNPHVLICDTDLLTIKIWCEDKFQQCDLWLTHAFTDRTPEMYFLCSPDFPWVPDPLREDETRRDELYQVHKEHLIQYRKRFIELTGSVENRMNTVLGYLELSQGNLF